MLFAELEISLEAFLEVDATKRIVLTGNVHLVPQIVIAHLANPANDYNFNNQYGNGNNKNPWEQDYSIYATSYTTEDPFKYLNNFDQKYNNFDNSQFTNFDTSSYNFDFNTKKWRTALICEWYVYVM